MYTLVIFSRLVCFHHACTHLIPPEEGASERELYNIFAHAHEADFNAHSRNVSVLIIDQVDAIGRDRRFAASSKYRVN